jgi:hypothetical protein
VDLRHEIFSEFAQPHTGDFSLAEFSQYFLVSHSLQAEVPARFSNKDAHPAILERTFEQEGDSGLKPGTRNPKPETPSAKGKSLLYVSSWDLEWNTLCLKGVFVPFVHQVTKRLCARRTGSVRNFAVGEEIAHAVPKEATVKVRRFSRDSNVVEWEKAAEVRKAASGEGGSVAFAPDKPGIYEVSYPSGGARFATNIDPREPDFRPLDTKVLLSTVQKGPTLDDKRGAGAVSVVAKSTARERIENRQRLWRYLLLAALLALTGEMFLATRIGRA